MDNFFAFQADVNRNDAKDFLKSMVELDVFFSYFQPITVLFLQILILLKYINEKQKF